MKPYLVIHHTVTSFNVSDKVIAKWKFYNRVIKSNGEVVVKHDRLHSRGGGKKSFDVSLVGNFEIDNPTSAQLDSLRSLAREGRSKFETIIGHKEIKNYGFSVGILNTLCPGKNLISFVQSLRIKHKTMRQPLSVLLLFDKGVDGTFVLEEIKQFKDDLERIFEGRWSCDYKLELTPLNKKVTSSGDVVAAFYPTDTNWESPSLSGFLKQKEYAIIGYLWNHPRGIKYNIGGGIPTADKRRPPRVFQGTVRKSENPDRHVIAHEICHILLDWAGLVGIDNDRLVHGAAPDYINSLRTKKDEIIQAWTSFKGWGVRNENEAEILPVPSGGAGEELKLNSGYLFKDPDGKVWFVRNKKKRWITSPEVLTSLWRWDDVKQKPRQFLDKFQEAEPLALVGKTKYLKLLKGLGIIK